MGEVLMLNKKRTLIVFAPGWGDPSLVIDVLVKRFQNAYPTYDTHVLSYMNRGITRSIRDLAEDHAPVLQALREKYETIVFIGHSLGGLVGRALLDYLDFDLFISIASPHSGTRLAMLPFASSISPSARDMTPWGLVPLKKPSCASLTISAAFDELLWPQESSQLPGVKNVKIPWTEHLTVATSQRTFLEISAWLDYEQFAKFCPDEVVVE